MQTTDNKTEMQVVEIIDDIIDDNECPICLDPITNKNNCTTNCGHKFCFKCIAKAMATNIKCPCCRQSLYDIPDEDIENSEDEDEEEAEYSDEDEDEEDDEYPFIPEMQASTDCIEARFLKKGYSLTDALLLLLERIDDNNNSNPNPKHNGEYLAKLSIDFNTLVEEADDEKMEMFSMEKEDIKSREAFSKKEEDVIKEVLKSVVEEVVVKNANANE